MELTVSYLLKAAITLCLLYLLYYGLLRNQVSFRFNRWYLLLTPLVALLFPLLKWTASLHPESAVVNVLQSFQLNEIVVTAYQANEVQAQPALFSLANLLCALYIVGAFFLLYKLIRQLWQVQQLKAQAVRLQELDDHTQIYHLPKLQAAFAFGQAIFVGTTDHLNATDRDKIMTHELAHVKLYHTWDILYYELLTALLWFNPVVWLLKQELRDVHEFQADAKVLQQYQPEEYSALLSREVLQQMGLPIGSYFQKPQVLKRLQMLQLSGQRASWTRHLLIIPALGALLFAFSVQAEAEIQVAETLEEVDETVAELEQQPVETSSNENIPAELESDESKETEELIFKELSAKEEVAVISPTPEPNASEQTAASAEDKPYTFVQQMPQFEGGDTELLKYLAKNIRYPEKARQEEAEGLVIVGFTVNDDGSLQDIRVLRPVEESIDAEALRVVEQMNGKWIPGRQNGKAVQVKYTLPVRFAIK